MKRSFLRTSLQRGLPHCRISIDKPTEMWYYFSGRFFAAERKVFFMNNAVAALLEKNFEKYAEELKLLIDKKSVRTAPEGEYPFGRGCAEVLDTAEGILASHGLLSASITYLSVASFVVTIFIFHSFISVSVHIISGNILRTILIRYDGLIALPSLDALA